MSSFAHAVVLDNSEKTKPKVLRVLKVGGPGIVAEFLRLV
jgi:hypothetical protein